MLVGSAELRGRVSRPLSSRPPEHDSIRGSARLTQEQRQAIAKVLLGLVHVVGATPELDVLDDGLATGGVWQHVVEFQEATE